MRFASSFPPRGLITRGKSPSDWPLSRKLCLLFLPTCLLACLVAAVISYRAVSIALRDSLATLPLFEAKFQAEKMENVLERLRNSLFLVAKLEKITPQNIRAILPETFQELLPLVAEIGLKTGNNLGFVLLHDREAFVEIDGLAASAGPYSPFHHITSRTLHLNMVSLFPAVQSYYTGLPGHSDVAQSTVIRMALPLPENVGTLVLGIDLAKLHGKLAPYVRRNSSLHAPIQEGSFQLAYFFDTHGWIIFEMGNVANPAEPYPDFARRGYTGDLGRPGLDATFRPLAAHEDFWRMVTLTLDGHAGTMPTSAASYSQAHRDLPASIGHMPVRFANTADSEPVVIGGMAFLETSQLPFHALYRVAAHVGLFIIVVFFVFLALLYYAGRNLGAPLRMLTMRMENMLETGDFHTIEVAPACEEHQMVQASANAIIARSITMQADMESIQREVLQVRARIPVDLGQAMVQPVFEAEFGLVGSSQGIRQVREQVRRAARAGTDVLVWGETGTGKELVAAAVHAASDRAAGPYISLNCGALDENLLLDALFGHVKGAFTEAKTERKGAFLAAEGGTLHLDEIATASPKVQQALLRALSVRRIRALGTDMETPFNTRVIAATNEDLRECVRKGLFREDLYYRLSVITIEVPALRQRKADIPELAAFCFHEVAGDLSHREIRLSRGALEALMGYDWPGNVREFKNIITSAMAFAEGDLILRHHITRESEGLLSAEDSLHRADGTDIQKDAGGSVFPVGYSSASGAGGAGSGTSPENDPHAASAKGEQGRPVPVDEVIIGKDAVQRSQKTQEAELNERQLFALAHITQQGSITRQEYESLVGSGISPRTAQNDLRDLVERGLLERMGGGPGTRYVSRTK